MIPRNAPVFRSTQQALHVAFLMGILPVTQKSNTQMLLERLMEEAGVAKVVQRDGTLNFAGLSPMEVRGQCAMVRRGGAPLLALRARGHRRVVFVGR